MRGRSGIHELAGRQHGVVSRRQLLESGWHRSAIDREIAAKRLLRVHTGVYAVGHRAIGDRGRWMAAVLAGGPGVVLSHRSAAALLEMVRRDTGITHVTGPVALTRRRIVGHRAVLDPADRTVWRGIPVTTVSRTLADLDHELADDDAFEQVVRETMFRGLFDSLAVAAAIGRRPARRLAGFVDDYVPTQTEMENRLLRICRRSALPTPLTQRGEAPRVDFVWPEARLVVEVDGWAAHRTRFAFQRDRAVTNRLQLDGFTVLRFTWEDLTRRPEEVAAQIRRALARR
jgi:very-short-patch-repair endonuclease